MFLRSLFLAAVMACFASGVRASQLLTNLDAGQDQTVVVYGTSLTAAGQWVSDLRTWLNAEYPGQATIINSGMSGLASNSGVANLDAKVISKNPDTVIIEFAVNDAFTAYDSSHPDYNISLAKSESNLNAMIDALQAANPFVEIILMTMNPVWDAPNGNQSATKRPNLAAYYQGYRDVAAARGLLLIDHYVNWSNILASDPAQFQAYVPDGVHPSATASTAVTFSAVQTALAVPEPSALWFFGVTAAGAGLCRMRFRKRS